MSSILITGANRGIGYEFARAYADRGWHVHACCRNPDRAEALKELAEGSVGAVTLRKLDVTDGLRVASLAREMADEPIDILLNNAGIYGPRTGFGEIDYDEWPPVLATNVLAPMRMAERFVEHVAASEHKLIVNISSRMGSIGANSGGGAYIYRSSKAALNAVVKSLSIDLARRGITVVAFHPGWVQTDMGSESAALSAAESVAGMRAVIDRLGPKDNGKFFNYDGAILPW